MTPESSAALAIFLYLFGGVTFSYVATVIAMRSPDWGSQLGWNTGWVVVISVIWPLSIFVCAPAVGIVLAQRGVDKKRLQEGEIRRLEAEVFGK
jgi:hypothetical protein